MDFLQHLLPDSSALALKHWELDTQTHQFVVTVESTQVIAHCPLCQASTGRVHSRYQRTLRDLPLVQFSLTLFLEVCKFFCLNDACQRRIFTERLPSLVAPWARRTSRYTDHLIAMGLELGGSAAARLSHQVGYGYSRNTFLRLLSSLPLPEIVTPKSLGVDDFAFRKGHHYGTILVDLETNRPIALLPDRTADTLATWLEEHPGIEILSRDRSKTYKRGMTQGAPDAIQVADRFHLLHNLEETLEKALKGHSKSLKQVEHEQLQAEGIIVSQVSESQSSDTQTAQQRKTAQKRAERLDNYEQVHRLRQQGYKIKDIAYHLGMGERTVYTYLSHETFPEWQPSSRQCRSVLDPYKRYLIDQWSQGRQHSKQLFKEIQQQGYSGTYETVARYTHTLRLSQPQSSPNPDSLKDLPGRGPAPKATIKSQKPLSARRAAWLVLQRPDTLTDKQKTLLERLTQRSELSETIRLTQGFIDLVRQRLPKQLDSWLEKAKNSTVKAFQSFAKGIEDDYEAVKAGMTLDVSNGPVEGQNNRLKMLKRQMFGRAGLDLLAKRLILTNR
ncbi:transposase family protein [Leptolyngbya sp. PCC 7375]|nr:transposase family protein [Leptolyngbya sp. PCC 7375]